MLPQTERYVWMRTRWNHFWINHSVFLQTPNRPFRFSIKSSAAQICCMATRSWSREGEGEGEEDKNKKRTATRMGNETEVVQGFPSLLFILLFTITKQNYTMRRILVALCSCYRHVLAMQRTVLPSSLSASFLMWNIGWRGSNIWIKQQWKVKTKHHTYYCIKIAFKKDTRDLTEL